MKYNGRVNMAQPKSVRNRTPEKKREIEVILALSEKYWRYAMRQHKISEERVDKIAKTFREALNDTILD